MSRVQVEHLSSYACELRTSHSGGRSENPHSSEPVLECDVEPPSEVFYGPHCAGVAQLAKLGNYSMLSWVGVQVPPGHRVVKRFAHHHVHVSDGLDAEARVVWLGCPTGTETAGCSLSASQVGPPSRGHQGRSWAQAIALIPVRQPD